MRLKSIVMLGLMFATWASHAANLAPKIFGKSSSGIISNVGTVSGSGFSFGGVHIGGLYYIMEHVALGLGYKVESDLRSIPLKGFDIIGRYYYLSPGSTLRNKQKSGDSFARHEQWNPYAGLSFSNRSFNVELGPEASAEAGETSVNGSISAFNFLTGLDYRIAYQWELTTEFEYTIIAFGGSDPRVKMKWMMFNIGLNFLF